MKKYDVIIIGAGASGLTAAATAQASGRRVAVLDMGASPARKVMVSGGGRCNLTNMDAGVHRYFGNNPDFVRGAMARVSPKDILDWAAAHDIHTTQKAPGQYFCGDGGAAAVVQALIQDARGADFFWGTNVQAVRHDGERFIVDTGTGDFGASRIIVATGGVSFPTLGVSDVGYKIAKSFGHKIVPPRPALCAIATNKFDSELAGLSTAAEIKIGRNIIRDSLLFTHNGIGGPCTYRATVRNLDADMHINLMPDVDAFQVLRAAKRTHGRQLIHNILSEYVPMRLARWMARGLDKNVADYADNNLHIVAARANDVVIPQNEIKLIGMSAAEVCRGGVDTRDVSSKTMESKTRPGLFFAGEVLDVAGDLGGFNLHWAWASGRIAGGSATEE